MIRIGFLVSVLMLAALARLTAATPPLTEPGPQVEASTLDADWQKLFDALAGQGAVESRFTEHRWFPFKKIPVELKGEMRLAPGHGLSLRYTHPEERTMVVDARGILLRDPRGRAREVAPDPRGGNVNAVLLAILEFDRVGLAKAFTLHAARSVRSWRLDFVPRDEALAQSIGRITVWGEDSSIRQLEFRRSGSQRVEIFIDESRVGVSFSDDELKRYFR